jgi:predicted SAM-dependent methyltransferase
MINHRSELLNLGCGGHYHPAWLNADLVAPNRSVLALDLQKPLPFSDGTFTAVYHSHVLEHLPRHKAPAFLEECFRVLKTGGIIRVVVPDLERAAELYLENLRGAVGGDVECQQRYEWSIVELLDQLVQHHSDGGEIYRYLCQDPIPAKDFVVSRFGHEVTSKLDAIRQQVETWKRKGFTTGWFDQQRDRAREVDIGRHRLSGMVHQWMYDRYSLMNLLVTAGFGDVTVQSAHTSRIPQFASYSLDVLPDGKVRKPDSLFMEGNK